MIIVFSVPDCNINQDQTHETAGEEADSGEDVQEGRQIKQTHV